MSRMGLHLAAPRITGVCGVSSYATSQHGHTLKHSSAILTTNTILETTVLSCVSENKTVSLAICCSLYCCLS